MERIIDDDESLRRRVREAQAEAEADEERDEVLAKAAAVRDRLRDLGRRLCAAREAAGYSVSDLSARTGIDEVVLSKIENGRENVTVDMLERCSSALGRSLVIRFDEAA
jgi:ribosome-binding protein aMBF1 (putative translation factor)